MLSMSCCPVGWAACGGLVLIASPANTSTTDAAPVRAAHLSRILVIHSLRVAASLAA
jgi:hypothetical protein